MDERDAIVQCLAGDHQAFGTLVERYQAQILGLCLRMTGNREDAADMAQQAFVQAFRHLHRYDQHQPFRPWLFKIATNGCLGLLRQRRHVAWGVDDEVIGQLPDETADTTAPLEKAVDQERVKIAVGGLPPQYQTVVLLHYFEGLSYQEVARQTGLPMGTIGTNLHRAKQLLRKVLREEEVEANETHRSGNAATLARRRVRPD